MGTLSYEIKLTDNDGNPRVAVSGLYIWRNESMQQTGDTLHYYASRTPPAELEYSDDLTLTSLVTGRIYRGDEVVEFDHTYSDGAELCVARAILALKEAGLNV